MPSDNAELQKYSFAQRSSIKPKVSGSSDKQQAIHGSRSLETRLHLKEALGLLAPDEARIRFKSHLDAITDQRIIGWVMLRTEPSHHCTVLVKEGDRVITRGVACNFRADLLHAGVGNGWLRSPCPQ